MFVCMFCVVFGGVDNHSAHTEGQSRLGGGREGGREGGGSCHIPMCCMWPPECGCLAGLSVHMFYGPPLSFRKFLCIHIS